MTDGFEGNGDYSYQNDEEVDFKRKVVEENTTNADHQQDSSHINEKANEYIKDCLAEKSRMDKKYPIAERLLDNEIEKTQQTGRIPSREPKYVDIYREKPIRVAQKVLVPVREHPKFNFVGKLLGPKGNSLRRLQEETLCKMTVLGRHSMKDRAKEEELRNSADAKYLHLNDDLHVEISTIAPPAEAHARIAYAMAELRKYLIPDSNDIIRQEQLRELMDDPNSAPLIEHPDSKAPNSSYKPRAGVSSGQRQPSYGAYSSRTPNTRPSHGPTHPSQHPPTSNRIAIPPKQKVMSILDRARSAMEDNYSFHTHSRHAYDEQMAYEQPPYDNYSYSHAPPTSRAPYEVPEYEPEYRRDYYQHSPNYQVNPGGGNTNTGASQATAMVAGNVNLNHNRAHVNR